MKPGILLLLALSTPAATQERSGDRTAIIAGERALGQAYVTGDVATVRMLLADGFRGIGVSGNAFDKNAALAAVSALPHSTSDTVDAFDVRFFGDTAVVEAREHEVGPRPEMHPAERVFTDTWVKQNGRWQIVAMEDLDPGLRTSTQFQPDIGAIKAARAANNLAIAEHDLKSFLVTFADDAVFTWSNGTHAIGRIQLASRFDEDFRDPNFNRYVRTPASISVSDRGVRAIERGGWTALKKGTRYGGDYVAHWIKTPEGWRVIGELYVKLYCSGSLCTP